MKFADGKIILTLFALLYSSWTFAQNGPEYDYRKKNESFLKSSPRNVRADVATFALGGISESIGTTPLYKIPYSSFGKDSMVFEADRIKAKIKLAPFNKEGHRMDYDEKYLVRIDRKPFYGDYGFLPSTYISEVSLIIYGDTVSIPKAAYSDLFNVNLTYNDRGVQRTTNAVYRSADGHFTYLYLFSKANKGSYEVTWVFQDKKYLRRILDYDLL